MNAPFSERSGPEGHPVSRMTLRLASDSGLPESQVFLPEKATFL
jgi:hypothetical protein